MNPAEVVFLYLPMPYWAGFLLLLYRHDLSRLLHPVRDDGSLRNWWAVLNYLGILDKGARRPTRKKEIIPYVIVSLSLGGSEPFVDSQVIPSSLVLPNHRPGNLRHRPHCCDHAIPWDPSEKALR